MTKPYGSCPKCSKRPLLHNQKVEGERVCGFKTSKTITICPRCGWRSDEDSAGK